MGVGSGVLVTLSIGFDKRREDESVTDWSWVAPAKSRKEPDEPRRETKPPGTRVATPSASGQAITQNSIKMFGALLSGPRLSAPRARRL